MSITPLTDEKLANFEVPGGWSSRLENHPITVRIVGALAAMVGLMPVIRATAETFGVDLSMVDDLLAALVVAAAGILGTRKAYGPLTVAQIRANEVRRRLDEVRRIEGELAGKEVEKLEALDETKAIIFAEQFEAEQRWRDEWEDALVLAAEDSESDAPYAPTGPDVEVVAPWS